MSLVVLPIAARPSVLAGKKNGLLPASILRTLTVSGQPDVVLVEPTMRKWLALRGYLAAEGVVLKTTSKADSYRSFEVQDRVFRERYVQVNYDSGIRYAGSWWTKRLGPVATAAIPGTSNHGWAGACDCDLTNKLVLPALERHAVRCGFSWELIPEEPWHIRDVTGDLIPQAVLDYEEDDMATAEEIANAVWAKGISSPSLGKPLTPASDWVKGGEAARQALGVATGEETIAARLTKLEEGQALILAAIAKLGGGDHTHDLGPAKPTD